MKINHNAEIAAALAERKSGVSLEDQKAAIKGKAVALAVVDGVTVAYAAERVDYTAQTVTRKKPWRKELDELRATLASIRKP